MECPGGRRLDIGFFLPSWMEIEMHEASELQTHPDCTATFEQCEVTQIKHTQTGLFTTWVIPAILEQTHPSLYPLAGDDCRLALSNQAVQIRVSLELADYITNFHTFATCKFYIC